MIRRASLLLLTGFALIAVTLSAGAAGQAQNGRIAFARGGNLWTVDPSGSGAVQITSGDDMSGPVWSPDGQRLAAVQHGAGLGGYDNALVVMRSDGSNKVRVSGTLRGSIQSVRWSPDGTKLVFSDDLFDATPRVGAVVVASADGSGQLVLTSYGSLNSDPSWAPDGTRVFFSSNRDGDADVFVMASDGRGVQKLTKNRVNELDPSVSPDGTRIAFARQAKRSLSIYVMKADGSAQVAVTSPRRASDRFPTWSLNGRWLAFWRTTSGRAGTTRIYRMTPEGTSVLALTTPDVFPNSSPVWSPDSNVIAFDTTTGSIYTVGVGGTDQMLLSPGWGPDWQSLPSTSSMHSAAS